MPDTIKLTGTEIIQLKPGCSVRMEQLSLPSLTLKTEKKEYFYKSSIHLELKKISPILMENNHLSNLTIKPPENVEQYPGKTTADVSLLEIERLLSQLKIQEQNTKRHQVL